MPRLGTAKDSIKYGELWLNPIIRVSKIVSLPNYLILSEKINDQTLNLIMARNQIENHIDFDLFN